MKLFLLLLTMTLSTAYAATPAELETRLAEIAELRELRHSNKIPPFSTSERARSAEGVGWARSKGGWVYGIKMMSVPISRLWAGLNDSTRHSQFTDVSYSEIIAGSPCKSGRSVFQYLEINVPFVSDRWWVGMMSENRELHRASGGSVREMYWRSSVDASRLTPSALKMAKKGDPIGYTRGAWLLVAIDEHHTWVEYHAQTDPGEGIPSGLASRAASSGITSLLDGHENFARNGNPSCPVY